MEMFQENVLCTSYYGHCKRRCFGNQVRPQPLSEQQEARQIFAGRCKRRATENLLGRPSKIIKQELASTLNSSAALSLYLYCQRFYWQRRKTLPALPKSRSQVSNDKYDKFQLDVLYLCISRCMMSLLK